MSAAAKWGRGLPRRPCRLQLAEAMAVSAQLVNRMRGAHGNGGWGSLLGIVGRRDASIQSSPATTATARPNPSPISSYSHSKRPHPRAYAPHISRRMSARTPPIQGMKKSTGVRQALTGKSMERAAKGLGCNERGTHPYRAQRAPYLERARHCIIPVLIFSISKQAASVLQGAPMHRHPKLHGTTTLHTSTINRLSTHIDLI